MNDAISQLLGMEQKVEEDPNETLIDRRILGRRPFNASTMRFLLLVSSACFAFTLAEIFSIISLLLHGGLVLYIGSMAINDLMEDYVKTKHIRPNFVVFICVVYTLILIGLFTAKLLVKAI